MTPSEPRLRLLCVGTGRDGTLSIERMFSECFARAGAGRQVMHEYGTREFSDAFANYKETDDARYLMEIRRLIAECPFDCIVGNGYAPILPVFLEICGPDLILVHIRRLDRGAAITSIVANCEYFPAAYGHYSPSPEAKAKRMTAFHFGEMSRAEWDALPLVAKMGWFYDKTHALIDAHAGLFRRAVEVNTETLGSDATRALIAELAGDGAWLPAPTHLNSHAYVPGLPADRRERIQWLMGRFDLMRAATDEVYPLEYFLNAFLAWTGYQLRHADQIGPQDYRSDTEMAAILARAAAALDEASRLTRLLEQDRIARSQPGKEP